MTDTHTANLPVLPGTAAFDALLDDLRQGSADRELNRILPFEQVALIKRARIGALRVPRAHGGGGLSISELIEAVIALGAADANVTHILRNHFAFVERFAQPAVNQGNDFLLREVAAGKIFGLASPELTTHNVGRVPLETRLVPDGDGYVVSGTKYYSTGTLYADYVIVRVQDAEDRYASLFLPTDREGIFRDDDWDGIGQRLTGSGTTRLVNVKVRPEEVRFEEPEGQRPGYIATLGHLYLTAILAGILRNVVEDATALVKRRVRSFAHAPAPRPVDDPLLQQTVGEISAAAFVAEAAVLAAAEALGRSADAIATRGYDRDLAHAAALAASKAKVVVDELAIRAGSQLFDVGGASAARREDNLDRHWRNARTLASHNPTSYKAQAIGNLEINGTALPDTGFF